jgi:hypothetical protein
LMVWTWLGDGASANFLENNILQDRGTHFPYI